MSHIHGLWARTRLQASRKLPCCLDLRRGSRDRLQLDLAQFVSLLFSLNLSPGQFQIGSLRSESFLCLEDDWKNEIYNLKLLGPLP